MALLNPRLKPMKSSRSSPIARTARQKQAATFWSARILKTYKLPVLITRASNNYGPYHFPEKLIPLMIMKRA